MQLLNYNLNNKLQLFLAHSKLVENSQLVKIQRDDAELIEARLIKYKALATVRSSRARSCSATFPRRLERR